MNAPSTFDLPIEMVNEQIPVLRITAPNPGPKTLEGTNTYIVGLKKAYVIDPGPASGKYQRALARQISQDGRNFAGILLTHGHPDHARGALQLKVLLGSPIHASPLVSTTAGSGFPVDCALAEGDSLETDGDRIGVLETPGHSADHLAFWLPGARLLFSGDTILGRGTSLVAPPEGDMGLYLRTLERMRELAPSAIAPGHGPVLRSPLTTIDEYIHHRLERERQVLDFLERGPARPPQIVAALYADVDPNLHELALGSVTAHLRKLEEEGLVEVTGEEYHLTSRRSPDRPG